MGLDINLSTPEGLGYEAHYFDAHALSRPFCHLMMQYYNHPAAERVLDRLGHLAGADVAPLYQMLEYAPLDRLDEVRYLPEDAAERQEVIRQAEADNAALAGNLERVATLIDALLAGLSRLPDLPRQLATGPGEQPEDYAPYFSDFGQDPGDGYIGNSFGQDLRNFRRFLAYAHSQGSTTVFFELG